jgi:uncharacterized protein YkwD
MATLGQIGRHRRRGVKPAIALAAGLLLVMTAVTATIAPTLLGGPAAGPEEPSNVAAGQPTAVTPDTITAPETTVAPTPTPAPTTAQPAPPPPPAGGGSGLADLEAGVLAATNAERAKAGCSALRMDDRLRTAARLHSEDMVNSGYFSHTSPDGSGPGERLRAVGYPTDRGWAENIARGYRTVESVMDGWMNSDGHRANILNCKMQALGVGVARAGNGRLTWTQNFGGR